jgi:multicomponent Na+:H+ antiporter subunit E
MKMQTDIKRLKWHLLLLSFLKRFVLFAAGWLVLMGKFELGDIWFVALFLAAATAISMYTVPPAQWVLRPLAVARFFPFFLLTSLRGGWDVAQRVFYRTVPIDPGFITIENNWDSRKTLILVWIISLLPGTASTVIHENTIIVHVLDKKLPVEQEIQELKRRINDMFVGVKV